jgi:hypothetical protein
MKARGFVADSGFLSLIGTSFMAAEFARAMVDYAKATGVPLHDLIDFMCITALADRNPKINAGTATAYHKAYRDSITMEPVIVLHFEDVDSAA